MQERLLEKIVLKIPGVRRVVDAPYDQGRRDFMQRSIATVGAVARFTPTAALLVKTAEYLPGCSPLEDELLERAREIEEAKNKSTTASNSGGTDPGDENVIHTGGDFDVSTGTSQEQELAGIELKEETLRINPVDGVNTEFTTVSESGDIFNCREFNPGSREVGLQCTDASGNSVDLSLVPISITKQETVDTSRTDGNFTVTELLVTLFKP
ncbi:hypothetical protein A2715_02815 [Candidatus Woesebacteria bacterium RIFCSPHIGHO2_01_FULL_39_32]|uniref:Uncharacterized protein n=1 Tax=Candidatus Woesebacteria bacterium RIFCSPLOWO2_01_FULL_39_25 TaxID=1802521 RepID=A0A1F8BL84_9BACT|nr:MAG: hypothetical protein A2715_02815 [Candidatus Woesebacteria bacterium RIFCSPHIGHO2_01_FULL_39_32]OGM37935.1 MAG: hypothetical protein A3F01_02945 [Candidatus Woesebacteria bacterium RIFCSPHIGHO2_12_FULL_38_11]OGM64429.1 MAG: hypothetical protein A2893_00990 [Candidatus Woesebacteria bacterium RIFCSPLOWO2_01_FULL_39_25]